MIVVYGDGSLPCDIISLAESVFSEVEGFGDVAGSRCSEDGWSLEIAFDTPSAFMGIIEGVLAAIHERDVDIHNVSALVRGRRYKFVDLL